MKKAAFLSLVFVLGACTAYVPVKQDYSKNEKFQGDLDATLVLRDTLREQRRKTVDLERKAELTTRIMELNSDMVSIKVSMGYPQSFPDPVDPIEFVRQASETTSIVSAAEYGIVIDSQSIDRSNAGTSGGAMLGSAIGGAAYIDRAFRPGNNYSALSQLGAGLLGAVLGAQLDRPAVTQFHLRYALRRRDGEIVYSDSVQQNAFRHPIGMCLRIADLQPVSQLLCTS